MRKLYLSVLFVFGLLIGSQAQTDEGSKFLELNTGFGEGNIGGTNFRLISSNGITFWNVGAEGGYFYKDDLAIKAGLGYGHSGSFSRFSYKLGGKYYIISVIPVEVSVNGSTVQEIDANPFWAGAQVGYALFLADNVALEPGIRYNYSLNENYSTGGFFQGNIGFTWFF